MRVSLLLPGLWVMSVLLAPAEAQAGRTTRLMYQAPVVAQAPSGPKVVVTWENARELKKGGKELALIGNERGNYGIPTAVKSGGRKTQHVDGVVPSWAVDCLKAAGYQAAIGEDPAAARLHVKVNTLWSEEIPIVVASRHETWIKLTLQLTPPAAAAPAWEKELSSNGGTTTVILRFDDPVEAGFLRAFDELTGLFIQEIVSDAFQAALPGADKEAALAAAATVGKAAAAEKGGDSAEKSKAKEDAAPAEAAADPQTEAPKPVQAEASLTEKAADIDRPAPFKTWDPLVYQWSGRETIGGFVYGGISVGLLIAGDQWARKLSTETYHEPLELSTFDSSGHITTTDGDPSIGPIVQAYIAEIMFDFGVQGVVPVFGTSVPTLIAANLGKDLQTVKAVMGFASVPSFLVPAFAHIRRFDTAQRHRLVDIPGHNEYLMIVPAAFSLAAGFADIAVAAIQGILGALYAGDVLVADVTPGLMPPVQNRSRLRNAVSVVPVVGSDAGGNLRLGVAGTF